MSSFFKVSPFDSRNNFNEQFILWNCTWFMNCRLYWIEYLFQRERRKGLGISYDHRISREPGISYDYRISREPEISLRPQNIRELGISYDHRISHEHGILYEYRCGPRISCENFFLGSELIWPHPSYHHNTDNQISVFVLFLCFWFAWIQMSLVKIFIALHPKFNLVIRIFIIYC